MCRSRAQLLLTCIALLISSGVCLILSTSVFAAPPFLGTCAECHGDDGMGKGDPMIPVIAGMPAPHIEEAIFTYVDGARRCVRESRMCETVAALSESEVAEIAEHYGSQVRGSSREAFDRNLAAEGAMLHQRHCARCHLPPEHEDVAFAVGIPLHGQRSEYLRFAIEAYFSGDREALLDVMADEIRSLRPGDLSLLLNYYSSYRSAD